MYKRQEVGGISATANPIANSSGSVTNQAIQVLQGPYITNTYGNGIQCQGATMNITPYLTGTGNFKRPFEHTYMDPVYDMSDLDDDGVLDNPGSIATTNVTLDGVTSQWNGLNLENRPQFTQTTMELEVSNLRKRIKAQACQITQ